MLLLDIARAADCFVVIPVARARARACRRHPGSRLRGSRPLAACGLREACRVAPRSDGELAGSRLVLDQRRVEIRAGLRRRSSRRAARAAPAVFDFLHRAVGELAQLERPERHADQPVHLQAERLQHVAHLAVLALADGEGEPDIGALLAVERRLDRPVAHAVDGDAAAQAVERLLRDAAVRAHAIAPQPAGRRQFEHARQPAVIGEQQQAFGVEVEPADADQPRQVLRQRAEDGRPPLRVGMGGHQAARLVVEEQPRALAPRQRLAVDRDAVGGVTLSAGEEITAPLTATRPAAIQASASRREARPARAITLAMRSPGFSLIALVGHARSRIRLAAIRLRPDSRVRETIRACRPSWNSPSTRPAPRRRAARCRSAA